MNQYTLHLAVALTLFYPFQANAQQGKGVGYDAWTASIESDGLFDAHRDDCNRAEVFVKVGPSKGFCIEKERNATAGPHKNGLAAFNEARQFCVSHGKRLPEVAEWREACRAGGLSGEPVAFEWTSNYAVPIRNSSGANGVYSRASSLLGCSFKTAEVSTADASHDLLSFRCVR